MSDDGSGFRMFEEGGSAAPAGSMTARLPLVNARLMPVTVAGTKTGVATFTGTFILPVVVTDAGMAGVIRTAGTTVFTVFVDVREGCGVPIPG